MVSHQLALQCVDPLALLLVDCVATEMVRLYDVPWSVSFALGLQLYLSLALLGCHRVSILSVPCRNRSSAVPHDLLHAALSHPYVSSFPSPLVCIPEPGRLLWKDESAEVVALANSLKEVEAQINVRCYRAAQGNKLAAAAFHWQLLNNCEGRFLSAAVAGGARGTRFLSW